MTFFHKNEMLWFPTATDMMPPRPTERLPTGTYSVGFDPKQGFYLETIDNITIEGKIYGDVLDRAARVFSTFQQRPAGTGILLRGEKGSGKTMLAKILAQEARKQDVITIVINTAFVGEGFNKFVASIEQPKIMLFDEFEKTYDTENQNGLLTLLDGVYPSKTLFILTCNDVYRVNNMMMNRPGRLFYTMIYKGLDEQFIREYCADLLNDKSEIDRVVMFSQMFEAFNFDMLKALVEEMNRYSEPVSKAIVYLNCIPSGRGAVYYIKSLVSKKGLDILFNEHEVQAIYDAQYEKEAAEREAKKPVSTGQEPAGAKVADLLAFARAPQRKSARRGLQDTAYKAQGREDGLNTTISYGRTINPVTDQITATYVVRNEDGSLDDNGDEWEAINFDPSNLLRMDQNGLVYDTEDFTLVIQTRAERTYDYTKFSGFE